MAVDPLHHSKRITLLRRLLLGAAILAALALFSLSNMDRFGEVSGTLSLTGSGPRVDIPDYRGRTDDGRAYRLSGETARQTDDGTQITAPILELASQGEDSRPTRISADMARFETDSDDGTMAHLRGHIEVLLGDGHALKTDALSANITAQTLRAAQPLTVRGPQLNLNAERFDGDTGAQIFVFHDLTMTLERRAP